MPRASPPNFGSILARQRGSGSLPAFVSLLAAPSAMATDRYWVLAAGHGARDSIRSWWIVRNTGKSTSPS